MHSLSSVSDSSHFWGHFSGKQKVWFLIRSIGSEFEGLLTVSRLDAFHIALSARRDAIPMGAVPRPVAQGSSLQTPGVSKNEVITRSKKRVHVKQVPCHES